MPCNLLDNDIERRNLLRTIKAALKYLKPPDPLTLSEWADTHRRISQESNPEPGRWYTEPYQREPMDVLTSPRTREMILMCASQMLKTEIALNALGYFAEHEPSPCLYVAPNEKPMAESFSIERIAPMIRDTPILAPLFADHRSRDSGNKILHKSFLGGFWALTGANSPAGLAMRPIRILILDEVDRFPKSAGKEGNPIAIATARTKRFQNRKILQLSSPTTEDGNIYVAYMESDQRVYEVPCPHCNHPQELQWERLKFDIKDSKLAPVYECENCFKHIEEKYKYDMVEKGKWRATAPLNPTPGFRLSEMVSVRRTWKELVEQFRRAFFRAKGGNIEDLRVYYNTVLCRTFQDRGNAPDHLHVFARRENYERGVVQPGGLFLTGAIDIQNDRVEVEIRAWGRGGESWSVDHLVYWFDTSVLEKYKIIETNLLENTWPIAGSKKRLPLRALGIDTGHHTQTVYMWARRQNLDRVKPLKGGPGTQKTTINPPSPVDIDYKGQKIKAGLNLWQVNVSELKNELYYRLQLNKNEDGTFPAGYIHFPDYDEIYFEQLVNESRIERPNGKIDWVKNGPNEALDLAVYNRALAILLGMDYLTESGWKDLEKKLLDDGHRSPVISNRTPQRRRVRQMDMG